MAYSHRRQYEKWFVERGKNNLSDSFNEASMRNDSSSIGSSAIASSGSASSAISSFDIDIGEYDCGVHRPKRSLFSRSAIS